MTPNLTTRELIDACRADHDDPQRSELPELAPLAREIGQNSAISQSAITQAYEQSQQFDRQVRAALDDVALPAGLAERLLSGCEAALVTPAEKHESALPAKRTVSRRKLILASFAAAASLLLFVLGGKELAEWLNRQRGPVSADELAQAVVQWDQQVAANPKNWQADTKAAQSAFPIDRSVFVVPSRVMQLPTGVAAYELRIGVQKRAVLFVQPSTRRHSIRNFPFSPLPATGAVSMSAWQRGGYVYVLVITDDSLPWDFIQRSNLT